MKYICLLALSSILACTPSTDPQSIIDKAIEVHGGTKFESLDISFDFRGKEYSVIQQKGQRIYTRQFEDSLGTVKDVLYNSTNLERYLNDSLIVLSDEWSKRYTESVNSVLYFFQLPYGLNDPAVQKQYLGVTSIFKNPYHKIKVTFKKENGGVDYEDEFIYWIHQDKNTLDYLAYSYLTDGGGIRFRQAINRRQINGLIVQDYVNFKASSKELPIEKLDQLYQDNQLIELSRIINENVVVPN